MTTTLLSRPVTVISILVLVFSLVYLPLSSVTTLPFSFGFSELGLGEFAALFNAKSVGALLFVLTGVSLTIYLMLRFLPRFGKRLQGGVSATPQFSPSDVGDRAAVMSIKGHRQHMEDTFQAVPKLGERDHWSFYGVFDGHGGGKCSAFTAQFLHKYIWKCLDAHMAIYSIHNFIKQTEVVEAQSTVDAGTSDLTSQSKTAADGGDAGTDSHTAQIDASKQKRKGYRDIPPYIQKMMKEALVQAHRDADNEFLKIAQRRQWHDGTTAISCLLLPAMDLLHLLTDPNTSLSDKRKPVGDTTSSVSQAHGGDGEESVSMTQSGGGGADDAQEASQRGDAMAQRIADDSDYGELLTAMRNVGERDTWLFVCNTGDSRCILVTEDGRSIAMSHDHKPNRADERRRIEADGGKVVFFGTWRVEGILAVARSLGDRHLKRWVIPDPDIVCRKVQPTDFLLVLASDGIWDVLSNSDVARLARDTWHNPAHASLDIKEKLEKVATRLTTIAFRSGSMDNITTLVVHLNTHCTFRLDTDGKSMTQRESVFTDSDTVAS